MQDETFRYVPELRLVYEGLQLRRRIIEWFRTNSTILPHLVPEHINQLRLITAKQDINALLQWEADNILLVEKLKGGIK